MCIDTAVLLWYNTPFTPPRGPSRDRLFHLNTYTRTPSLEDWEWTHFFRLCVMCIYNYVYIFSQYKSPLILNKFVIYYTYTPHNHIECHWSILVQKWREKYQKMFVLIFYTVYIDTYLELKSNRRNGSRMFSSGSHVHCLKRSRVHV